MSETYEVHLRSEVDLDGSSFQVEPGLLRFEVGRGVGEWSVDHGDAAIGFSQTDRTIVIPAGNVALLDIWG